MFESFNGKTVSVIGIGVSNTPLIRKIIEKGGKVVARDRKSKEQLGDIYHELSALGVSFRLGEEYLADLCEELIFKTPGLRYDVPELLAAAEAGCTVTSEMEMFFEVCPAKIIAVTGSDGKTTTTTLIYEMLKKQGYTCWLGGNIGTPLLCHAEEMKTEDMVVLELSSFQLHTMKRSPHIAVITNLSPNHLDYHTDMAEYQSAKENIFRYQKDGDLLILNADNDVTSALQGSAKTEYFSRAGKDGALVYLSDGWIYYDDEQLLRADSIRLPGVHNIENYMAAIAAVRGLVSPDIIRSIAENFGGVPHRIEFIREKDGVKYYNDSIASSPTRAKAGLYSFSQKVIMIAGGYDKHIPFTELGAIICERVKSLILMGATADLIAKAVHDADPDFPISRAGDMTEAVAIANRIAEEGDIVILSPACASFDMFRNFEERGNCFRSLVEEL